MNSHTTASIATETTVHIGWKIHLGVLGLLVIGALIIIVITWKLRYKIKIHSRVPKKVMKFKMSDKLFSFPLPKSLSLAALVRPSLTPTSRASELPRNMGNMIAYSNGMKRDSWDVSRDSVSGGPRSSWAFDSETRDIHAKHMLVSKEPKLSIVLDDQPSEDNVIGEEKRMESESVPYVVDM